MKACEIYAQGQKCQNTAKYEVIFRGGHYGDLKIKNVCNDHLKETCETLQGSGCPVEDIIEYKIPVGA